MPRETRLPSGRGRYMIYRRVIPDLEAFFTEKVPADARIENERQIECAPAHTWPAIGVKTNARGVRARTLVRSSYAAGRASGLGAKLNLAMVDDYFDLISLGVPKERGKVPSVITT